MGRRFLHANFKQTVTSAFMQLVHGGAANGGLNAGRRALAASALLSSLARSGVSSTSLLAASAMPLLRAAAPFSINAAAAASAITNTNSRYAATAVHRRTMLRRLRWSICSDCAARSGCSPRIDLRALIVCAPQ